MPQLTLMCQCVLKEFAEAPLLGRRVVCGCDVAQHKPLPTSRFGSDRRCVLAADTCLSLGQQLLIDRKKLLRN